MIEYVSAWVREWGSEWMSKKDEEWVNEWVFVFRPVTGGTKKKYTSEEEWVREWIKDDEEVSECVF